MGLDVVDRLRLAEVSGCWVRRCCAEFLADLLHLDGCDDTVIADVDWWSKTVNHERTWPGWAAARAQGNVGGRPTGLDADKLAAATGWLANHGLLPIWLSSSVWEMPSRSLNSSTCLRSTCSGRTRDASLAASE